MRIAIASFDAMPSEFTDDERLSSALVEAGAHASVIPWSDPEADWDAYDLVVIRTTWDYTSRRDEFVDWAERLDVPLHNSAEVVRWNSDKRYLADLAAAGLPVVETSYVAPGEEAPEIDVEVVVKPTVSVGARDTGRFSAAQADRALNLVTAINSYGKTAMVQPFNPTVDEAGETALVMIDGDFSHALRKRAVLRPDEVAPMRADAIGAAEVMYEADLVRATEATAAELEAAEAVMAEVERRFGEMPLYGRVDLLQDERGEPVLLELEAIEPNLYHGEAPGSAEDFAKAIVARAGAPAG